MNALTTTLNTYCGTYRPSAFLMLRDGEIECSWGAVDHPVNVKSVRKSLLSALYGIAVDEGEIAVERTLASLGVDDVKPSLTDDEKQATIQNLLTCTSGIFHSAAYETSEMAGKRPARGSHAPGEFWYYNNWDFNALGTIYRQSTGRDIFEEFERRIAQPLKMDAFDKAKCRYQHEDASTHPAYIFELTACDLAKFGMLYLREGRSCDQQIIPKDWVSQSTRSHFATDTPGFGYGYMWWVPMAASGNAKGSFIANGNGGQMIVVIPARDVVVVQTVDLAHTKARLERSPFFACVSELMKQLS